MIIASGVDFVTLIWFGIHGKTSIANFRISIPLLRHLMWALIY